MLDRGSHGVGRRCADVDLDWRRGRTWALASGHVRLWKGMERVWGDSVAASARGMGSIGVRTVTCQGHVVFKVRTETLTYGSLANRDYG